MAPPSTIASACVARITRTIRRGMVAAEPAGDGPAVAADIIAAVRRRAVTRRSAISAAVLQTPHQHQANPRLSADRNSDWPHLPGHPFPPRWNAQWGLICHRQRAVGASY